MLGLQNIFTRHDDGPERLDGVLHPFDRILLSATMIMPPPKNLLFQQVSKNWVWVFIGVGLPGNSNYNGASSK